MNNQWENQNYQKYAQTKKGKKARKKASRNFWKTKKGQMARRKYRESPKGKLTRFRFSTSETGKNIQRKAFGKHWRKYQTFLRTFKRVRNYNEKQNLPIPHYGIEEWKNGTVIVSRFLNGRFLTWEKNIGGRKYNKRKQIRSKK